MARITNNYTMLWELSTKSIMMDFRNSLKGLDVNVGVGTGIFESDTLADMYAKYTSEGLNDNYMLMFDDPNINGV